MNRGEEEAAEQCGAIIWTGRRIVKRLPASYNCADRGTFSHLGSTLNAVHEV
jgi:hypothetical protein